MMARRESNYQQFLADSKILGRDIGYEDWAMMFNPDKRTTMAQIDDLKSNPQKFFERVKLQRKYNKYGPEGLWEKGLWLLRAPESFFMRMARFGGPIGLTLISVFDRDPSILPAVAKSIITILSQKGMPLNLDWKRMSGTTYDMMSLERQHHRELGDEPLLLAEANGFHPRDSYYSSWEEVDRLRISAARRTMTRWA